MTPGTAHLYGEGDLHSVRRKAETRLIRIEGIDLTKVKRDKYEPLTQ
jgi:hypothetical protein